MQRICKKPAQPVAQRRYFTVTFFKHLSLGEPMKTRSLALPFLALCFAMSSYAYAGDGGPGATVPAVSVEAVRSLTQSDPKVFVGTVSGMETVGIVPRVSGTLWKVAFQEGAIVREGDVLFEIEDTVYKANVLVAEALIQQAEADLELAKKDHERNTELLRSRAISTQAYDTTLATQLLKEARVEEAKANLILKQHDLEYCRIVSPLTGRIGEKAYSEGNYITPSSGILATVVRYQPSKVQFSVSESDFFRYFNGHAEVNGVDLSIIRANGKQYTGSSRIDFVDNIVDRQTDTLMISLECDNPDDQLLPGGFVQVQLSEKYATPVPAISLSALMTDGSTHYVYVIAADETIERRLVEISDVIGRYQAVRSGLRAGERVVIGGINKVSPGMKVRPVAVDPVS